VAATTRFAACYLRRLPRPKTVGIGKANIRRKPDAYNSFEWSRFVWQRKRLSCLTAVSGCGEQVHPDAHSAIGKRPKKGQAKFLDGYADKSVPSGLARTYSNSLRACRPSGRRLGRSFAVDSPSTYEKRCRSLTPACAGRIKNGFIPMKCLAHAAGRLRLPRFLLRGSGQFLRNKVIRIPKLSRSTVTNPRQRSSAWLSPVGCENWFPKPPARAPSGPGNAQEVVPQRRTPADNLVKLETAATPFAAHPSWHRRQQRTRSGFQKKEL
jgi:hypothetical protein